MKKDIKKAAFGLLIGIVVTTIYFFVVRHAFSNGSDVNVEQNKSPRQACRWQEMGQFGDTFGGLTSFFTVLAFVAVGYGVWCQRRELNMQEDSVRCANMPIPYVTTVRPLLLGCYGDNFLLGLLFTMRCPTESSMLNYICKVQVLDDGGVVVFENTSPEIKKFLGRDEECTTRLILRNKQEIAKNFLKLLADGKSITLRIETFFCNTRCAAYRATEEFRLSSKDCVLQSDMDVYHWFGEDLSLGDSVGIRISKWFSKRKLEEIHVGNCVLDAYYKSSNPVPDEMIWEDYKAEISQNKHYPFEIEDWDPNSVDIQFVSPRNASTCQET